MQPRDNWGIYSFLSLQCLAEGLKCNSFEACISKDGYSNTVGGKKGDGTFFFFIPWGKELSVCLPVPLPGSGQIPDVSLFRLLTAASSQVKGLC